MPDDLILPTDEQVERAARAFNDLDQMTLGWSADHWPAYRSAARQHLVLLLNKDRILGESEARLDLWSKCDDAGMAHAIANIRATELDCADWGEDLLREIVNAVIAGLNGQCYVSKRKD